MWNDNGENSRGATLSPDKGVGLPKPGASRIGLVRLQLQLEDYE
jgi:hypothetical protein